MGWLNNLGVIAGIANTGMSIYGGYKGIKQGKQQVEVSNQHLELMKQRDAERRAIYGDLEKNLADYYNKLTPEQRTQRGLDRYDRQFKLANERVQQMYAQRGLTGSGIEGESLFQMEQQAIMDRMQIQDDAERSVMQEKLGFLGMGQGQGNITQQAMANATQTHLQSMNAQQNAWMNIAQQSGKSVGDLLGAYMYGQGRKQGNLFGQG